MASPVNDNYSCASGSILYAGVIGPHATSLTLTDYAVQRVIQRLGSSRDIAVIGTYTGNPVAIQARVINATTSAVVVNWTTIHLNPTGGNFSGLLTVPASANWYYLQVRDRTDTSVVSNGTNKWGVGACVGLMGQSNMVNFLTTNKQTQPNYPTGDIGAVEWNGSARVRVGNINDTVAPNSLFPTQYSSFTNVGNRADGYVYLANRIVEELGVLACIVHRPNSGTSITTWVPGATNYENFIDYVDAIGGDIEAAIYYQGEQDAHTMSTTTWKNNLALIHAGLHTQTGRTSSNFKFGVVALGTGFYNGSTEGEFGAYRVAQIEYATTTAGAFLASANHDSRTATDTVHIDGESFARFGRRYVAALIAAITGATPKAGPKIASASRSGTTITAIITHSAGTSISDGDGGSGTALTGFRVFDNGSPMTISSTSISGNNILLTLSSTPTGTVTMDYGIMNCPHNSGNTPTGTVVMASVVYDNATYYNSVQGFPLQPCAAITVT